MSYLSYQCLNCGQWVGTAMHSCIPQRYPQWWPPATLTPLPNKCGACGATTIDHTDAQCERNQERVRANTKPVVRKPKEASK